MPVQLDSPVMYLPGVGPARSALLESELGIRTMHDLLYHFPYKYIDRRYITLAVDVKPDMPYVQLKGHINSMQMVGKGRGERLSATFTDETGTIGLVWFQGIKYVTGRYSPDKEYIVFGKPAFYGGRIDIAHPEIDLPENLNLASMGMIPSYETTERMKRTGLNSKAIQKMQYTLISGIDGIIPETLPEWLVTKERLMPLDMALRTIHFPKDSRDFAYAQYRLKFEELFYIQLSLARLISERRKRFRGIVFEKVGERFNDFYQNHLPFNLTNAQKRVVKEIRRDTGSGVQMNRLLQGDVGSGKTMVALLSMLLALDNGCQACIIAPTEILSEQHYINLTRYLSGMEISVELLTGSVKGKRRESVLERLASGEINILVSTHAALEDTVVFKLLGMVVIDEQHRFGVAQRARMWTKNTVPPHVLVMTATPIPRTLAMTLYGDLDVSVIDELPPGRKPISTSHWFDNRHSEIYAFIRKQLQQGRQAYIVYPLIEESAKMDLKNLEEGYETICKEFSEYQVAKVHGKMKPQEKDGQMNSFKNGDSRILVATTVIEVGVDVPNASVMVIENAERFGLAQLHQLRGRVGRGADQSFCLLVTGYKLSQTTRKRIETMVKSTDGFEIAEADLKLRGPGDIEGTQQSGISFDLKISNIAKDGELIEHVRRIALDIVKSDPGLQSPENRLLGLRLSSLKKSQYDWSSIS